MNFDFINLFQNFLSDVSADVCATAIVEGCKKVFSSDPMLKYRLSNPSLPDFQNAFNELTGKLEAMAGTGDIKIDKAVLSAMRSAKLYHQDGKIYINDTEVFAPVIEIGGGSFDKGQSIISGNTELRTAGTSIITKGSEAFIKITGNGIIKQT